jgi:hypothetical protein
MDETVARRRLPRVAQLVTGYKTTVIVVIALTATGTGRDGDWLRVSRHGMHVADVRTVAELAGLGIDLADLQVAD